MRAHPFVLLASAGLLSACIDELPSESSSGHSVETHNRLGANRLGANRLGANHLAAEQLASSSLGTETLSLNTEGAAELLATEGGREVLAYIVSCAAPEGTILTVENPPEGTPSEYFGSLGLAPDWLSSPLDDAGIGWVSACLFARVNANDEAVPISLRGLHPELASTPAEEAAYVLQEGAFWGNYFTPVDQPIQWFSCTGHDQAAGETGGLGDRDCAEASLGDPNVSQCGFTHQGNCFAKKGACKQERHGVYTGCDDDSKGPERQVITTYVTAD